MHCLFLCTAGKVRSRTAAYEVAKRWRVETRHAGVGCLPLEPLTIAHVRWADVIFCMEPSHHSAIEHDHLYAPLPPVITWEIPDIYDVGDPDLSKLATEKFSDFWSTICDPLGKL